MKNLESFEYLDAGQWSPLWERYVQDALLFVPSKVHEILCIVPVPGKEEVLIVSEEGIFTNNKTILKTLHTYASTHCYPDYPIISHMLRQLGVFGQYKLPWFCPYFSLFPLEGSNQAIWLNPLKIKRLFKNDGQQYVEMMNGLILLLSLSKRRVVEHAEVASLLLATIARGHFHPTQSGNTPLDFLQLPNTPFAQELSRRPMLQTFITSIGELWESYQISYALHHFSHRLNGDNTIHRHSE